MKLSLTPWEWLYLIAIVLFIGLVIWRMGSSIWRFLVGGPAKESGPVIHNHVPDGQSSMMAKLGEIANCLKSKKSLVLNPITEESRTIPTPSPAVNNLPPELVTILNTLVNTIDRIELRLRAQESDANARAAKTDKALQSITLQLHDIDRNISDL